MKRIIRAAALAVIVMSGATTASAVPIKIDFTGSVVSSNRFDADLVLTAEPIYLGQSVTGWILIETEGLQRVPGGTSAFPALGFNDVPAAPELITSSLFIGGTAIDVGLYDVDTGSIRYLDSIGPVSCGPGCSSTPSDRIVFTDSSAQVIVDPLQFPSSGTYFGRSMTLFSAARPSSADPTAISSYFDLSQNLDAMSATTLPLDPAVHTVIGSFSELTTTCIERSCRTYSSLALGFDITSVVRQVVQIPTPGTLPMAMLAFLALGANLLARRRSSSGQIETN